MQVTLHQEFAHQLNQLTLHLQNWRRSGEDQMWKAMQRIGERFRAEAVKRVPVDTGRLVNAILKNTYRDAGEIFTEVGTNVKDYPAFVEFGTEYIAKGAVLALGERVDITDAEAIHWWPAKAGEATENTSVGLRDGKLINKAGDVIARQRPQEQMPWLRPSFMAIRAWAVLQIENAVKPPAARGKTA